MTHLTITREDARSKISDRIERGVKFIYENPILYDDLASAKREYDIWDKFNIQLLQTLFTTSEESEAYSWFLPLISHDGRTPSSINEFRNFQHTVEEKLHRLQVILEKLELYPLIEHTSGSPSQKDISHNAIELLSKSLRRFHSMVRQIKFRHDDRDTITITDEYDVQDLMHVFLKGLFDDVRPEDSCPSYAGSNSRVDFVLKKEQIVIETKMTNARLKDKQIGEQLILDIAKYQTHPDCKHLICFVYDPTGLLRNPAGIEADLARTPSTFPVIPIIVSV